MKAYDHHGDDMRHLAAAQVAIQSARASASARFWAKERPDADAARYNARDAVTLYRLASRLWNGKLRPDAFTPHVLNPVAAHVAREFEDVIASRCGAA